jgi:hypothetical protein
LGKEDLRLLAECSSSRALKPEPRARMLPCGCASSSAN